ncbi:hypothetical protein K466DRAFT_192302 [Polyporus arcularius HHB13444]|uniref:Uncharacterized protein n=1 Tax=Polyporus arcularius HHB13444 TaxID=1314778 RepID=A0A5C3PAS1_9APHY|nr:hypothetical protein K466DRAFT_192302 [Polyporus arcularius HHB13444]
MPYPQEVDDSRLDLIRYIDPAPSPDGGYTYNWTHITDPEAYLSPYYNRTISVCLQSGAMALFTFEGTRVSVYGSEPDEIVDVHNWSSYSINGQSNHTYNSGALGGNYLLLFDSGYMPYGEYTLQIYVGHAEDDAGYYLDYIKYETTSTSAPTSTSQPSALATPTYSPLLSLSTTAASSNPTVTSSSSQTLSASSSSTTNTTHASVTASVNAASSLSKPAAISLATLGGVACVILLALFVFWLRRKRGQYRRIDLSDEIPGERQGLFPFFSEKSEGRQVLFSASPPPTPTPASDTVLPQAADSVVAVADGSLPPYDTDAAPVVPSDEKPAHLSVVGTISAGSTSSDDEDEVE